MSGKCKNVGEHTRTIPTQSDSLQLNWLKENDKERVLSFFRDRFGIPMSVFDGFRMAERARSYWIVRDSAWWDRVENLKIDAPGLMILRKLHRTMKPTTAALQVFGPWITSNIIVLNVAEFKELIREREIVLGDLDIGVTRGFVAIRVKDHIVGCGYFKDRLLVSQIPKTLFTLEWINKAIMERK